MSSGKRGASSYTQRPVDPRVLDLGRGQPSPTLLPLAEIAAAAARRLARGADPELLQYGAIAGYPGVRAALAEFLSGAHGRRITSERLMLTAGISTALTLVSQRFARPGATVICGDPTYFLAPAIFRDAGLKLVGIPVDDGGLCVEGLEAWLAANPGELAFVYCIPSFHNPTGVTLRPERARRLVELAERHDFVVVADEPYRLLHRGDGPPPGMLDYDEGRGRVLALGSFSKLLGPGLRLGWAAAEPELIARLAGHGALQSGGGLNPLISAIVHETLTNGFLSEHLARLRSCLTRRADALHAALRRDLPEARVAPAEGGYFLWAQLPRDCASAELAARLREAGVAVTAGSRCALGRELGHCMRLCFAYYDEPELTEAVRRLADGLGAAGILSPRSA